MEETNNIVVKYAITNNGKKILVSDISKYPNCIADGISIKRGDEGFIISPINLYLPFANETDDAEETEYDNSFSSTVFDGEINTDFCIDFLSLDNGTACVEAKKYGYLPCIDEMNFIGKNKDEINALLENIGGDIINDGDLYWTCNSLSRGYMWHYKVSEGFAAFKGDKSQLNVRPIKSLSQYDDIEDKE